MRASPRFPRAPALTGALLLLAASTTFASPLVPPADAAGDRFTGQARSGQARGAMVLDLLAVDGDAVTVQVRFSGGLGGIARLSGLVRRGVIHLSGMLEAGGAHFLMAMRAQPRDDGGLAGVYELSEQQTRQRQLGDFVLAAADTPR